MTMQPDQLDELLDRYATFMRSCYCAETTVRARVAFARARLREWDLSDVTEENVRAYFAALVEERRAQSKPDRSWTVSTYNAHMRNLTAYLHAARLIPSDPMVDMKRPKRPKGRPNPLSDAEVDAALVAADPTARDMMLLALYAGLRVSEIARMRGEVVRPTGLHVLGKGGDIEVLPCHEVIAEMAERYPTSGYWFPGDDRGHYRSVYVSRDVCAVFRRVGIESGGPHRLRHTYGTRLLQSGRNIREVQRLMRHAGIETTANYTAVDDAGLSEALSVLPPPNLPPAA